MLHPFFSTLIRRPDLIVAHVASYGALVQEEAVDAGMQVVKRVVAWAMVGVLAIIFLMLSGVAVMVGFANEHWHWTLVGVPGLILLMAIIAFAYAKSPVTLDHFVGLRAQLQADVQALKSAGENA